MAVQGSEACFRDVAWHAAVGKSLHNQYTMERQPLDGVKVIHFTWNEHLYYIKKKNLEHPNVQSTKVCKGFKQKILKITNTLFKWFMKKDQNYTDRESTS